MEETQHLARLAYQNGEKALQAGWWPYVQDAAKSQGISESELLREIERLKSLNGLKKGGDCEAMHLGG